MTTRRIAAALATSALFGCSSDDSRGHTPPADDAGGPDAAVPMQWTAQGLAELGQLPAGVAAGDGVVFVGSPLEGRIVALSSADGRELGVLPAPAAGFVLPFNMHSVGPSTVAVLDAGGLPSPAPFVPANPTIFEYEYRLDASGAFSAELTRTIPFTGTTVGFAEDIARLDDGRYLLSDAVLGAIWVAETDGTIRPGIVPKSQDPADAIPTLSFCPNMPQIDVGGVPFLFSGSTLPGVSPLAVRNGEVHFYSPCAEGLFSFPLSVLSDARAPEARAADIELVAGKPSDVEVEQLLGLAWNPHDAGDPFLYAADSLKLRVVRIDVTTGERQVLADDPALFAFPSSTAFLPREGDAVSLVVVSNQQHRTPLTNDAVTADMLEPPFVVAKVMGVRAP